MEAKAILLYPCRNRSNWSRFTGAGAGCYALCVRCRTENAPLGPYLRSMGKVTRAGSRSSVAAPVEEIADHTIAYFANVQAQQEAAAELLLRPVVLIA